MKRSNLSVTGKGGGGGCNQPNWIRIVQERSTRPSHQFLEGKRPSKIIPYCAALATHDKTPIFIPVNIMEKSVELVARKILGISGPGGTDSEALQGCLLKFGEDSTRLRTSVETFVEWLANGSPPWLTYRAFMLGRLIAVVKQPYVRLVGVGETWRRLFAKIVLKVTGPESTMACHDDQL